MLKPKELEEFKALLLDLQARVRGDVDTLSSGALGSEFDSKSPTHMAELGTETYEQDFSLRVMEGDQEVLKEIRAALKRIDNGTYGLCEGCQSEGKTSAKSVIPKMRLKVIPYARHCVSCAEKHQTSVHY
jgi:DnaK suppressor protein